MLPQMRRLQEKHLRMMTKKISWLVAKCCRCVSLALYCVSCRSKMNEGRNESINQSRHLKNEPPYKYCRTRRWLLESAADNKKTFKFQESNDIGRTSSVPSVHRYPDDVNIPNCTFAFHHPQHHKTSATPQDEKDPVSLVSCVPVHFQRKKDGHV